MATSPPPVMAPGVPPGGEDYGVPVRLRLPAIGIDLPVISSKVELPGNKPGYPLCDVAQYWTRYALPGLPGTTWIFGHARPGMMGPILENVQRTAGESLLGLVATVQVEDGRLFHYRIFAVKQHATDQAIALREDPAEQRLIIQTSEGPPGTIPKLQVATRLEAVSRTSEPPPDARPTMCWVPPAPVRRSTLIAIVASAGMLVVAGAVWHTRRRAGGGTGPPDDPGVRAAA